MTRLSRRSLLALCGTSAFWAACTKVTSPTPVARSQSSDLSLSASGLSGRTSHAIELTETDVRVDGLGGADGEALLTQASPLLADEQTLDLGFEFRLSGVRTDGWHSEWSQQFPGFFVYIDRVETHPLVPCVAEPVKHFHVIVKRSSSTPDTQAWSKLHLGTYQRAGKKCYVLYDSQNKWICVPTCGRPTIPDLAQFFRNALTTAFAAAGIVVAAWVIASAADVLAAATIGLVLAL